jgi:arsenite methyltransferase
MVGMAGTLEAAEYRDKLTRAGFEQIDIEPTRVYRAEDARDILSAEGIDVDAIAPQVDGKVMSAFIRAKKPVALRNMASQLCTSEGERSFPRA